MESLPPINNPAFYWAMTAVSFISSGWANFIWATLLSGVLVIRQYKREAGILFLGYTLGGSLINILKPLFGLPRPPIPNQLETFAFPSGHVMTTTILVGLLICLGLRRYPQRKRPYLMIGMLWVAAVGLSRVYLQAHWPLDVLGGFLFGALFVVLWAYSSRSWVESR